MALARPSSSPLMAKLMNIFHFLFGTTSQSWCINIINTVFGKHGQLDWYLYPSIGKCKSSCSMEEVENDEDDRPSLARQAPTHPHLV